MEDWLRVFEHEMSRRRKLFQVNQDQFGRLHSVNPKGLTTQSKCSSHVWVPATHLMIHDNSGKLILNKIRRRGFSEAAPFKDEVGACHIPQICWNCDATRERVSQPFSAEIALQEFEANRPRKKRGRRVQVAAIEPVFSFLFDDIHL